MKIKSGFQRVWKVDFNPSDLVNGRLTARNVILEWQLPKDEEIVSPYYEDQEDAIAEVVGTLETMKDNIASLKAEFQYYS